MLTFSVPSFRLPRSRFLATACLALLAALPPSRAFETVLLDDWFTDLDRYN